MKIFNKSFVRRKLHNRSYLNRISIILLFLALMTLMMPRSFRLQFGHQVGKPWLEEDLEAPFDFSIYKPQDSLLAEQEAAMEDVPRIYQQDSAKMKQSSAAVLSRFVEFENNWENYVNARRKGDSLTVKQISSVFFNSYYPSLNLSNLPTRISGESWNSLQKRSMKLIDKIYERGYLAASPTDSIGEYISLRTGKATELLIPGERLVAYAEEIPQLAKDYGFLNGSPLDPVMLKTLVDVLEPNYIFDPALTEQLRIRKKNHISPVKDLIRQGDVILRKGEVVSLEKANILNSLIKEEQQRFGEESRFWFITSQFLIVLLISLILLAFLYINRPRIYFDANKLGLVLLTIFLVVAAMVICSGLNDLAVKLSDILGPNINLSYIYLAPACIVPIFMINFFDARTAYISNLIVALFGGVLIQQGLEFVFVQILAGTVAVYYLRNLRERETFFYTLGFIFLAYTLSYIAFNLYSKNGWSNINYNTILLFVINVVFTIIAYNLIYLFEQLFKITSDLTYLELLDTNHPLLQKLARKAPGTFQHSLQVANIAEATINEIGGNALLIHVAAMYHDIGKMSNAQYFIENMSEEDKKENPHDKIACSESSRIIIGHVKEGVKLAQKHHLPKEIIQFIETHHGTTRVEFFYRQYLKEMECQEPQFEELFRYPGPLPSTREMAVLMIADSIEAAARSIQHPNPEKLENLVNSIIDFKIKDKQLDNSPLTFTDINSIRKVITKQLLSIYHARIEYPDTVSS